MLQINVNETEVETIILSIVDMLVKVGQDLIHHHHEQYGQEVYII